MKSHYRPHKMALWNNLVPDLVKLSEREIDVAIDKLPHSRWVGFQYDAISDIKFASVDASPMYKFVVKF